MEVCGNCAWYSEGFSGESLAAAITSSQFSPDLRDLKITEGLIRVRDFSPRAIAARTFDLYLEALSIASDKGSNDQTDVPMNWPGGGEVYGEHLRKAI